MSEGFIVYFYNKTKGHVLKCCMGLEGSNGFFTKITEALKELDKVREDFGYEYRQESLRLNKRR